MTSNDSYEHNTDLHIKLNQNSHKIIVRFCFENNKNVRTPTKKYTILPSKKSASEDKRCPDGHLCPLSYTPTAGRDSNYLLQLLTRKFTIGILKRLRILNTDQAPYGIINKIQTTPTRRKRNNSFAINQRETSGIIALTVCGCQVRGFSRDSGFNHSRPRDIFLSGYSPLLFIYKNYNRKILRLRCNIYRVFTLCCCCYKLCFLGA